MRKKVIAGNWKMNMLPNETIEYINADPYSTVFPPCTTSCIAPIREYKHIPPMISDLKDITKGSNIYFPKGYLSNSFFAIKLFIYKDNIVNAKLINEYNPSNIIISDCAVHPHAIPNSAKNNAPTIDIFKILFSSFIIFTSIQVLLYTNIIR